MVNYYLNEKDIDPAWVDEKAQAAAKSFFETATPLTDSQLRRFYGDVKTLERQWMSHDGDDAAFAAILPLIKLLKAKVTYASTRKVVPDTFRAWLCKHVDSVNSIRDFRAFTLHFEAVVGFSYGFADKNYN